MRPVTIPQDFWVSLGPERQAEVLKLEERFGGIWATGSRVICPSSVHANSDWDVYAMSDRKKDGHDLTWGEGFLQPAKKPVSMADRSVSLTKNGLNLIIFYIEIELRRFHEATEFCVSMGGPDTREKRVKVFRKFLGYSDESDYESPPHRMRHLKAGLADRFAAAMDATAKFEGLTNSPKKYGSSRFMRTAPKTTVSKDNDIPF